MPLRLPSTLSVALATNSLLPADVDCLRSSRFREVPDIDPRWVGLPRCSLRREFFLHHPRVGTTRAVAALLLGTAVAFGQPQAGAPWPMRGHDSARTSQSAFGSAPSEWNFTTGGAIFSSPAIGSDGTVFVGSDDHKVYALNGSTGAIRWSRTAPAGVTSSPAISADGTVVFGFSSSVVAVVGDTGASRWGYVATGLVSTSPAIGSDGTVYIGSSDGKLIALYGMYGTLRWNYNTGSPVSSPAIGTGGTVYTLEAAIGRCTRWTVRLAPSAGAS